MCICTIYVKYRHKDKYYKYVGMDEGIGVSICRGIDIGVCVGVFIDKDTRMGIRIGISMCIGMSISVICIGVL